MIWFLEIEHEHLTLKYKHITMYHSVTVSGHVSFSSIISRNSLSNFIPIHVC